jgi:hypothetical protein
MRLIPFVRRDTRHRFVRQFRIEPTSPSLEPSERLVTARAFVARMAASNEG